MFSDERLDLLIDFGGEFFCPCHGTTAAKEYKASQNTTNPYIIDWQIVEPKGIHAEYQQEKKDNLEMLTSESRRMKRETHRERDEQEVNGIGNQVAQCRPVHAKMRDEEIV